jgi:hypothetical protein
MFCELGNTVKDYVMISWPYTQGSVRWAKWRLLVTDGWWNYRPVGKVVQPLQSVNSHDSHAHGHERHGHFTWLVGYGWFGPGQVLGLDGFCYGVETCELCLVLTTGWDLWALFGFDYRGETCDLCLVLTTGVRPVSFIWSSYRGETCKPVALGYNWVTKVQCHA